MDLIDKLAELSARIQRQKDTVLTEEAAKTAFVLPFIQALGYDVFNPAEVIPELTADHGVKKGEKVDYAIKLDGKIAIIIECKSIGANLEAKHAGQLFRYFSVTDARFGVLTDGIRYVFFSDLEKENKMDDRPFLEFNLFQISPPQIDELKMFTKTAFDLDAIIGTASDLKYHKALIAEIQAEFDSPSEDIVKLLAGRVYSGRVTQQVKDHFSDLTKRALRDFVRTKVNERIENALDNGKNDSDTSTDVNENKQPDTGQRDTDSDGIVTTPDELEAHRIIRAIGAEFVNPDRIAIRDAKSYCAILLDNNNRRPICRLHFNKTKMSITIFTPDNSDRHDINNILDIYSFKSQLIAAIGQYEN